MNHVMLNAYTYFVFAVTYLLLTGGSDPRHASPCFLLNLRPPLLTTWQGIWIIAAENVANSIRSSDRFSVLCLAACRGDTGSIKALHAFRLQARPAITM